MMTRNWIIVLAVLTSATTLDAQSKTSVIVAGVADADTHAPLPDAQVRLPDLGRLARTDWMGEARIGGVPFGPTRIEVRKLGYAPPDITLPISGDSIGPQLRSVLIYRMNRNLGRWECEYQPASADIHRAKLEHIAKKRAICFGILAVEEKMGAVDHQEIQSATLGKPL